MTEELLELDKLTPVVSLVVDKSLVVVIKLVEPMALVVSSFVAVVEEELGEPPVPAVVLDVDDSLLTEVIKLVVLVLDGSFEVVEELLIPVVELDVDSLVIAEVVKLDVLAVAVVVIVPDVITPDDVD